MVRGKSPFAQRVPSLPGILLAAPGGERGRGRQAPQPPHAAGHRAQSHPHFQRMSSWLPSGLLSSRAKKPCARHPHVSPVSWVDQGTPEHRGTRARRGGARHQPAGGLFARTGALRSAAIARCQPCRVLQTGKARRESSAADRQAHGAAVRHARRRRVPAPPARPARAVLRPRALAPPVRRASARLVAAFAPDQRRRRVRG